MNILAIDSSAVVATVAVATEEGVLAEYTIQNGNTHSETLLPMVESALGFLGLTVADMDLLAASAGPGSFTGVRIGVATLKGLAFGMDKPCVEVSTPEALAENLRLSRGLICPVMNARRSQVYTALFRSDGETLTRLMPDSALSLEELNRVLSQYGEEVCLVGDGYDMAWAGLPDVTLRPVPPRLRLQSAASVAAVALREYRAGASKTDAAMAVRYLRPSQAERERLEKEKNKPSGT